MPLSDWFIRGLNSFYSPPTYRGIDVIANNYLVCLPIKDDDLQHMTFEVK